MVDNILKQINNLTAAELIEFQRKMGLTNDALVDVMERVAGVRDIEEYPYWDVDIHPDHIGTAQKIQAIKVIREVTGLGLKEAKEITDGNRPLPASRLSYQTKADLRQDLEAYGMRVKGLDLPF